MTATVFARDTAVSISVTKNTSSTAIKSVPTKEEVDATTSTKSSLTPREKSLQEVRSKLSGYARCNERKKTRISGNQYYAKRMTLQCLKDAKVLRNLPLPPNSFIDPNHSISLLKELHKELSEQDTVFILNNSFVLKQEGLDNRPIDIIKCILRVICKEQDILYAARKPVYANLINCMAKAKELGSIDAHSELNATIGSSDLTILPITTSSSRHQDPNSSIDSINTISTDSSNDSSSSSSAFISHNNDINLCRNTICINLYAANGHVHMTMDMTYNFGFFRKCDIVIDHPWISIQAAVHERSNLSTMESIRYMNIKTPRMHSIL